MCAISSTTYWFYFWCYSTFLHCLEYNINNMHVRIYLFLHVIILIMNFNSYGIIAIFLIHFFNTIFHKALAVFKLFTIVITNYIAKFRTLCATIYTSQMIKSLIPLCCFWNICSWNHIIKFTSQSVGIYHFAFCISSVNTNAFYMDLSACSIEIFIFKIA